MKRSNINMMLESWLYTAVFFHGILDPMIDYFYDSNSFVWWSFQTCGALLIIIAVFFSRQLLSKKWTYTLKKLASEQLFLNINIWLCFLGIAIALLFDSQRWIAWTVFLIIFVGLFISNHNRKRKDDISQSTSQSA